MEKMTRRQIKGFLLLGVLLTALTALFPLVADRYAMSMIGTSTLHDEEELVDVLRKGQTGGRVWIGLHGYDHKCPTCGATDHELYCSKIEIPLGEIDRRITQGLKIFDSCGLRVDWYAFPGEAYDNRCIAVLKGKGFYTVPYRMGGEVREMPVNASMLNFAFDFPLHEYTWNWRNGVSGVTYEDTISEIGVDRPLTILMHIQDYTNQTRSLLEYVVAHGTTIIRCDDVTSNWDLENVKGLTAFCVRHNVTLLLAVIPTFVDVPSSSLSAYTSATWYMFLVSFVFPVAVTVPWAVYFKVKRRIKPLGGNPHYPSVSLIFPAYNEEKIIGQSIAQGLNQDYPGSLEIVVIDDGSTDNTRDIVRKYADRNVRLIEHGRNRGKPAALNTGFASATGEISIFQDTDSVIASDLVSRMVAHFKDPEVGMVAGMIVIENECNLLTRLQQIEYLYSQTIVRFCQASHQNVLVCPGAATAVRTPIARSIPSTDRTVTEDADFTFEVMRAGWKVSQEPEAVSYTEAPEKLAQFIDQRKRWLYGVLQTIVLHKWALHNGNLWVVWAWLGYILCPLTILAVISIPIMYLIIGGSFLWFWTVYMGLTLTMFMCAQVVGVLCYSRAKARLLVLLPIYVLYQAMMQLLLVGLVLAYVTGKGIHVRYGGKIIHAVKPWIPFKIRFATCPECGRLTPYRVTKSSNRWEQIARDVFCRKCGVSCVIRP